jgi:hypothetical protein
MAAFHYCWVLHTVVSGQWSVVTILPISELRPMCGEREVMHGHCISRLVSRRACTHSAIGSPPLALAAAAYAGGHASVVQVRANSAH